MDNTSSKGRHILTASGRKRVLFVDLDGTIVVCEPFVAKARRQFARLMHWHGFNQKLALKMAHECESEVTPKVGFNRERFVASWTLAYKKLCRAKKKRPNPSIVQTIVALGWAPYIDEPIVFTDAVSVLTRARKHFHVVVVTLGDYYVQKYLKIERAGLRGLFDEVIITETDNKLDLVRAFIENNNVDPEVSAFVGNSKGSDGVCLEVTNFIYLPLEPGRRDDVAHLPSSPFKMLETKSWRHAEEAGIKPLLRKSWEQEAK